MRSTDDAVVVELDLLGTHLGPLGGIEPTGRTFRSRMCALFIFEDGGDGIVCERGTSTPGTSSTSWSRVMPIARWKDLCIDATDAHRMAPFWGGRSAWRSSCTTTATPPCAAPPPEETIWVNAVPEPRTVKQRVHLDLDVASVEPVLALGAPPWSARRPRVGLPVVRPRRPRGRRAVHVRAGRRGGDAAGGSTR